MKDLYSAT